MNTDKRYMRMALRLAARARGLTNPNPAVGAVIVKAGRVVGTGFHRRCGLPHAEVNAIRRAGPAAKGATLYVTLEPCNHFGRTPPCTEAIIQSGIRKVVVAMKDPNPITSGRGIRKLKQRGIRVVMAVLEAEARELNKPFTKYIRSGMPYVTLKIAESLDGKIATRTGDSKWITSPDARAYVHSLRRTVDAVMVGVNTVIKDDPLLLARTPGVKQPARVIVDSTLKTPLNAGIIESVRVSPVIIATTRKVSSRRAAAYVKMGATVIFTASKKGRVDLRDLMKKLGQMEIIDILVEGGGEISATLIDERLADRMLFFIAPKIIGGRNAVPSVGGDGIRRMKDAVTLNIMNVKRFSKDILLEAEVN